ncbi:SAM-dependent methyltransferase [Methylorubrum rhodinum]|uniref:SAM-dependent methyltransferase n=1 Tax=Methylorubrum rhodinum TaxID=29428 RepID=A0A840ZEE4_9HYPH|nr:methyltransferase domain-containing protein [Methylorubrum rhodinum]MBB5755387.1 SAM-dependent methyltransferase [Methylorubrum rhodinum]
MLLNQILSVARTEGIGGLLHRAGSRLVRARAGSFKALHQRFDGRRALEIGGPSACFRAQGYFPVYPRLAGVDNCNFASTTLWEGTIEAGASFHTDPARPPGRQFIAEATDLAAVPTGAYEVILSSHTIEHTANPLKALAEWRRLLTEDGLLVLIAPHKDRTFDHRRPVTRLDHLIADFEAGTGEDDRTHLPEILAHHDLSRDPGGGTREDFVRRSQDNLAHRALHHHVFDTGLAEAMLRQAGFRPLAVEARRPYNIVVVAQKGEPGPGDPPPLRFASPFPSDRG